MPGEAFKAKVLLLGDGGVGKTSLIRRFVVDQYSDNYITTVGTKVSKRDVTLGQPPDEIDVILQIWDVLGQKGYGGVHETAVKGAQGVLLVYDLTQEDTRRSMEEYWMPMVWRLAGRVPAHEYLYYLSQKFAAPSLMTSAKTGDRVDEAFRTLAERVVPTSKTQAPRLELVTPPQEPVDRLIRVADKIMTDFCYQMGGVETGMPIVKRQFERSGVDVRAPSEETLRAVIDRLAEVERDFKTTSEIETNRQRRTRWLGGDELD